MNNNSNSNTSTTTNNRLKILYWNARRITQRKYELQNTLRDIDIFVCVETWLKPHDSLKIPGFITIREDRRNTQGGGILFLVRKKLVPVILNQITKQSNEVEIAGIRIENTNPPLDIVACYRIPGYTLSQTEWNEILSCTSHNKNSILVGDFNAHNVKWNCKKTDVNGERLEQSIENQNMFLHNTNTHTHIDMRNNNKSNIDLVLSTMSIADKINFEVYDGTLGSDHFPIVLDIDASCHTYQRKSFKITSLKTNWDLFENILENKFECFYTQEYVQMSAPEKYECFTRAIIEAAKSATPRKKKGNKKNVKNPVHWWDTECNKIKRLRRAAYKKWEYTKNLPDLIELKKTVL